MGTPPSPARLGEDSGVVVAPSAVEPPEDGGAGLLQPPGVPPGSPNVSFGGPTGGLGDGIRASDASVTARFHFYLPLVHGGRPRSEIYDSFDNPAYDGTYNPVLWTFGADSAGPGNIFQATQRAGEMVFRNTPASVPRAAGLGVRQPGPRTLAQVQVFEARLKLGGQRTGGWSETSLLIISSNLAGHGWLVQCGIGGRTREPQATPFCNVSTNRTADWPPEYLVYDPFKAPYDTWHTIRIEANRSTAEFRFFFNGALFGSYVPTDAAALLTASNLEPMLHVWAGDPNTTATHWADDVRITPVVKTAQPEAG